MNLPLGPDQTSHARPARRLTDGAPLPVLANLCTGGNALRVILPLNAALVLLCLLPGGSWQIQLARLMHAVAVAEPILLLSLIVLCLAGRRINGLSAASQWAVVLLIPACVSAPILLLDLGRAELPVGVWQLAGLFLPRWLTVILVGGLVIYLLRLRALALAPSLSEARLQALQARIRPHFLFNSLNTVLGLMRSEPARAEFLLENLSDLFRVFMRDTRDLVPIEDELVTCRQYLSIEASRLGERLQLEWDLDGMAPDALIPSLLLQPLIENAIHHGIEPGINPGRVRIKIAQADARVIVRIENTLVTDAPRRPGNQMGLSNVRERLMLLYDTSARFEAGVSQGVFQVELDFPYRKERRSYARRTFNPDR